jgi:hypothetical protein
MIQLRTNRQKGKKRDGGAKTKGWNTLGIRKRANNPSSGANGAKL